MAVNGNGYDQMRPRSFMEFTSSSNNGQNFTLILTVEAGAFSQETNRQLSCEIRDLFNLKTKIGEINDLLETDDWTACISTSRKILRINLKEDGEILYRVYFKFK